MRSRFDLPVRTLPIVIMATLVGPLPDVAVAQSTYTWNVASGAWTNPSSWTPARNSQQITDILVVDGGVTPTASLIGPYNQIIGRLILQNGVQATLQTGSASTIAISGGSGTDLDIQAGSTLRFASGPQITIQFNTGTATGIVSGSIIVHGGTHTITTQPVTDQLVFASGGTLTTMTGYAGSMFSGALGSVAFQSGSTYVNNAGNQPFAAFQPGSLYKHQQTTPMQLAGRTFGDLELNFPSYNQTSGGGGALTVDDLTITAGTAHVQVSTVNILGDVSVAPSGNLDFNPGAAQSILLIGSTPQAVSHIGALNFNANTNISIGNASGVTIVDDLTLSGTSAVNAGAALEVGAMLTVPLGMAVNGTLRINDGGWVQGLSVAYGANSMLVFNNASELVVTGAPLASPPHVSVQGGGDVVVLGELPITHTLTLTNGRLVASDPHVVVLFPGCSVMGAGSASYVHGDVRRHVIPSLTPTVLDFPVGDATTYAPVSLTLPSVSTSGWLQIETVAGDHAGIATSGLVGGASVNRHWSIVNSGTEFSPCAAVFNFTPGDVDAGADPLGFVVKKFDSPAWSAPGIGARTSTSIEATGIDSFSDFQVGRPAWEMVAAGLQGTSYYNSVEWGDYDGDGDLDLVIAGSIGPSAFTNLMKNTGGTFTSIPNTMIGLWHPCAAWGDYDGDGDLDLLLNGDLNWTSTPNPVSKLYRQEPGDVFEEVALGLPGLARGGAAWADYDNDGDLDFVISGLMATDDPHTKLFRNDGDDTFTEVSAGLVETFGRGTTMWADYDNDGDEDLLVTGYSNTFGSRTILYRNDGGTFADSQAGLPNASNGVWGDFDNDGDLDLLMNGVAGPNTTRVYRNELQDNPGGTVFIDAAIAGLPPIVNGGLGWGDHNNDGFQDFLIAGHAGGVWATKVMTNVAGTNFVDAGVDVPGVWRGDSAWGDYDGDGDLDFIFTGLDGDNVSWCDIQRNNTAVANTLPAAPTGLTSEYSGGTLTLSWNAATDAETPAAGLTYNVRIGTTPDGNEILACMADASTGYRRVVRQGNAGHRLSWSIHLGPNPPPVYWSVQAIDAAFAGSPWGTEAVVTSTGDAPRLPTVAALHPNWPNPFATSTQVAFDIPHAGHVTLAVFDVFGRRVRTLHGGNIAAGRHAAGWDGRDDHGRPAGAGVYWVQMEAGKTKAAQRITLVR